MQLKLYFSKSINGDLLILTKHFPINKYNKETASVSSFDDLPSTKISKRIIMGLMTEYIPVSCHMDAYNDNLYFPHSIKLSSSFLCYF